MTIGRAGKLRGAEVHPSYKGVSNRIGVRFVRSSDEMWSWTKKKPTKGAFGNKNKKKQNKT